MANYIPPDLSEEDLTYFPLKASKRFAEELEDIINIWTARYPKRFTRYDAILILSALKTKLEGEENAARRAWHTKKREPEHGQYTWVESRQRFVLINKLEAERLHLLESYKREGD